MKTFLILLLCSFLILPPVLAQQSRPAPATSNLPKDFDSGLKVALEASKELGLVEDREKVRRVNEIGYRIASRGAPDRPYFSFRIVKMEDPNAFALPGGFIFITSGMLDLDLTDDELAAVLGHEVSHVTRDHIHRMSKRQTLVNLLYQALLVGVAFGVRDGGSDYNPVTGLPNRSAKSEILQGSAAFGALFQELLLRGFSRDFEVEADHYGMIAAAGAGFSPQGTTQLFDKMRKRIYEAPGYGYWMTHPYLEERSGTARTEASSLQPSKNPPDVKAYAALTQSTLLQAVEKEKDEDSKREIRQMALNACPAGPKAEELRAWFITQQEKKEDSKQAFYRDYGKLIKMYTENIEEVRKYSPNSEFIGKQQQSMEKAEKERDVTAPLYQEVLAKQVFDTEMLERFISNWPDSPRLAEVQFRLAENYRILKKQRQSVDLYLKILDNPQDSEWRRQSRQSLAQLLPSLDDLSACYKVSAQSKDPEIGKLAQNRMKDLTGNFKTLQNGYDFRRSYPASAYEVPVRARMTQLATYTLKQGKIYQSLGEYQQALDQYNQILRYGSDLPIADQVKDTIVDFEEVNSIKNTTTQF